MIITGFVETRSRRSFSSSVVHTIEPTREFYENGQRIVRIIDEKDLKEPIDLSIPKKRKGFVSLEEDNPAFLSEFDYELNFPLLPKDLSKGTDKKVWWTISVTERDILFLISWKASINNKQNGKKCPYLENQRINPLLNSLQVRFKDIAEEWCYEKNDIKPTEVAPCSHKKVYWKCKKCGHIYPANIASRTKKDNPSSCPECNKSKFQRYIENVLRDSNLDIETEIPLYKYYRFDISVGNNDLLIECDGSAHWQAKHMFDKKVSFKDRVRYDNEKNTFALEQGIPLLRVPYLDMRNEKNRKKIESWVLDFIDTKQIPEEIIQFYEEKNPLSNYPSIAREMNTWVTEQKALLHLRREL